VDKLFVMLRQLADQAAAAILYISHKLDEIRALCHRCTVMRGGKVTGEVDPRLESNASLSRLMIGAEPPELLRQAATVLGEVALSGASQLRPAHATTPFGVDQPGTHQPASCAPVKSWALPGCRATGSSALMAALSGEDLRSPASAASSLFGKDVSRMSPRPTVVAWGSTACLKSAWAVAPCLPCRWPRTHC
jgi:ABC-type uncharacterized transport system ATPase subunit